jgi:hypothetical protein
MGVWDWDVGCGKRLRAYVAWACCGTKRPFATKVEVLAAVCERRWPHCHAIEEATDVMAGASGSRRGKDETEISR